MASDPEGTRQRIFDAAVEEFAAHGNAGARVDRIAEKARANKESIYRYFGTKDELLQRVLDRFLDERGEQFLPQSRDMDDYGVFMRDVLRALPGVTSVESMFSMREVKRYTGRDAQRRKVSLFAIHQPAGRELATRETICRARWFWPSTARPLLIHLHLTARPMALWRAEAKIMPRPSRRIANPLVL